MLVLKCQYTRTVRQLTAHASGDTKDVHRTLIDFSFIYLFIYLLIHLFYFCVSILHG